jgi:hypothetical protein
MRGNSALLRFCSPFPAFPVGEKRASKSAPAVLAFAQLINRVRIRNVSAVTCSTTKPHLSAPSVKDPRARVFNAALMISRKSSLDAAPLIVTDLLICRLSTRFVPTSSNSTTRSSIGLPWPCC